MPALQPSGFTLPIGPAYILHAPSIASPPSEWALLCYSVGDTTVSPSLSVATMVLDQTQGPVAAYGAWQGEASANAAAPAIDEFARAFGSSVLVAPNNTYIGGLKQPDSVGLRTATGRIEPRAFVVVPEDEYSEDGWMAAQNAYWFAAAVVVQGPSKIFRALRTGGGGGAAGSIDVPGSPITIRSLGGASAFGSAFGVLPAPAGLVALLRMSRATVTPGTLEFADAMPLLLGGFTRSGSAWQLQPDNTFVQAPFGSPRLETGTDGVRRLRIEQDATNRVPTSTGLVGWTAGPGVSVEHTGGFSRLTTSGDSQTASITLGGFAPNALVAPQIIYRNTQPDMAGALLFLYGSGEWIAGLGEPADGWRRLVPTGGGAFGLFESDASGNVQLDITPEFASVIDVLYVGAEEGTFATSPISTNGAPQTRNAETASVNLGVVPEGVDAWTFYVRVMPLIPAFSADGLLTRTVLQFSVDETVFTVNAPGQDGETVLVEGPDGEASVFAAEGQFLSGPSDITLQVLQEGAGPTRLRVFLGDTALADADMPGGILPFGWASATLHEGLFEGFVLAAGAWSPAAARAVVQAP